jgi:quinohemoprotein amine dehydrogenase
MVRLNGLSITPVEARHVLDYLSKDHGLAPDETTASRWYLEMRPKESENIESPEIRIACASCHPLARPQTWRRSATEWKLLVNMRLGYFPVSENNSFHARLGQTDMASCLPRFAATSRRPRLTFPTVRPLA